MRDMVYLGIGMVAISGFHLVPAVFAREIPARGAMAPLTYEDKPILYRLVFWFFAMTGIIGVTLLIGTYFLGP